MIQAIVTDIEGTTSSLSFVKDVLFPYARTHLAAFVHAQKHNPIVRQLLDDTRGEMGAPNASDDETVAQLLRWIDEDKKITPLKALQGLIWETGYREGDFHGHIYPDALARLREWHGNGLRLYVFSSGSVKAQQLLFAHTEYGDLTPLFSGYFDTTIGAKREPEAYRRISNAIGAPAKAILFLSDIKEELDAARAAGMQTVWVVRSGQTPAGSTPPAVRDFNEITLPP